MKITNKNLLATYLILGVTSFIFQVTNSVSATKVRTYLAFDGLNQKNFADCVSDPRVKQDLSSMNHSNSESLYRAVDKRISDLSTIDAIENTTNITEGYQREMEHDCLEAVRAVEKDIIERFHENFADIDTYMGDHAKVYMEIDENGNTKSLTECGADIDISDRHSSYLEVMDNAYYQDVVNWQRTPEHDCLVAVLYLETQQNKNSTTKYNPPQPNSDFSKLIPEEAYIIILHDVFNQSLEKLSTFTYEDLEGKFTSQYIMLRGNGTLYQADKDTHEIGKKLDNIVEPWTGDIE